MSDSKKSPKFLKMARKSALPILREPGLWPTAIRMYLSVIPHRWWSHKPFLPVPTKPYIAFRVSTHSGDSADTFSGDEVVQYLRWCRDYRSAAR